MAGLSLHLFLVMEKNIYSTVIYHKSSFVAKKSGVIRYPFFAFIALNSLHLKVHGNRKFKKKVCTLKSKYDVKVPSRCPDVAFFVSIILKEVYVMRG